MGLDRDRLARLSVESYLQQLLRHGLFHADPHPGNVAVDAVGGGRLIYYDFGMMGRIVPGVRCVIGPVGVIDLVVLDYNALLALLYQIRTPYWRCLDLFLLGLLHLWPSLSSCIEALHDDRTCIVGERTHVLCLWHDG